MVRLRETSSGLGRLNGMEWTKLRRIENSYQRHEQSIYNDSQRHSQSQSLILNRYTYPVNAPFHLFLLYILLEFLYTSTNSIQWNTYLDAYRSNLSHHRNPPPLLLFWFLKFRRNQSFCTRLPWNKYKAHPLSLSPPPLTTVSLSLSLSLQCCFPHVKHILLLHRALTFPLRSARSLFWAI